MSTLIAFLIFFPFGSHRTVYFHALSSNKEFSVPNYILKNETRATSSKSYYEYTYLGSRGSDEHSASEFFDEKTNVLFYTKISKKAIGCWLASKSYMQNTQGSIDSLAYPTDIKIERNGNLWVLSNRMPVFLYKALSPDQFNYHILFGKASEIIKGKYKWQSEFV